MKVLIAGGAGYIGSTVASACLDAGITPIIVDNFLTGRKEFVRGRIFYEGDIADHELIDRVFRDHPDMYASILCAAVINVPDSVQKPVDYYRNNVSKSLRFVEGIVERGCDRLLFSSSASIYETNLVGPVDEHAPIEPLSPYAKTKAVSEWVFEDIARSGPLRVLSLRYFNPIGADPSMRSGLQLSEPTHVLGRMIQSMQTESTFQITGTDYPTRDGSGIRDYVHVWDIAQAHVLALENFDGLFTDGIPYEVINLGSGSGTTVKELLAAFNMVSGVPISVVEAPRREGDNAGSYASFEKAHRLLGWSPQLPLASGILDSLTWAKQRDQVLGGGTKDEARMVGRS
ncbi:MAG: UDP-glucose 4-epimerase GalE [Nitrososphaerales archaeon]|jgi:UDP-glucose 4-epimerase